MSENPYQSAIPVASPLPGDVDVRSVAIRPIRRLSDAKQLWGNEYWLMVGVCVLLLLITSAVPVILCGPLICGLHLCLRDRSVGVRVTLERAFDGFHHFIPSLIVCLVVMVSTMLAMLSICFGFFLVALFVFGLSGTLDDNTVHDPHLGVFALMGVLYGCAFLIASVVCVPFLFACSLIVDQQMDAWSAIRTSCRGARKNFLGLWGMLVVYSLISMSCAMACYVPFLLVAPLLVGGVYLVYRDIFPNASPVG